MLEQMTQPRLRVHLIMDSGSSRTVVAASGVAGSSAESAYEQADDGVCRSEPVSSRTGEVGSDLGQSSQDDGRNWLDLLGTLAENLRQRGPEIP